MVGILIPSIQFDEFIGTEKSCKTCKIKNCAEIISKLFSKLLSERLRFLIFFQFLTSFFIFEQNVRNFEMLEIKKKMIKINRHIRFLNLFGNPL